jgi:hypothetical protein
VNGLNVLALPPVTIQVEAAKEERRKADWDKGLFDLPLDDRDECVPALSPIAFLT